MSRDDVRLRLADHLGIHAGEVTVRNRMVVEVSAPFRTADDMDEGRRMVGRVLKPGVELIVQTSRPLGTGPDGPPARSTPADWAAALNF